MSGSITDVAGVLLGHAHDSVRGSGVTVLRFPRGAAGVADIRGEAAGTRQMDSLLRPHPAGRMHALVFAGGSAFGLAAADGVMAELERAGRGHPTPVGPVPIVPTAVIFDLFVGDPTVRPGPAQGAAATRSASGDPVEMGSVGAGTGATVAGWRGPSAVKKGGLGSACTVVDDALVGALVVVNAVGDVFTLEGEPLTGGPLIPGPPAALPDPATNTTLVVIATNARLGRNHLLRVAVRAQDALAVCLRPGHTRYDGDAAFAVSCGEVQTSVDLVGEAAFVATGRAIEAALRAATTPGSG